MKPTTHDRYLFDLHCDTIGYCYEHGLNLRSKELPHLALDRLPEGFRLCQCMAVFVPDEYRGDAALRYVEGACDVYRREMAQNRDAVTPVEDTACVEQALQKTPFASILTVEGGAAIAGDPDGLRRLWSAGVRMMTLTWNGANELAGGADTSRGFTSLGRRVVAEMERLGLAVDVSHLSDAGFWELCEFAEKPFAASHSNVRAVCPHRRNLTDPMFREIVRRGGVVGINYFREFIVPGGDTGSIDDLLRHIHHFLDLGGEDTVALGSDFDGADMPVYLSGLDKIGALVEALEKSGIPGPTVDKILFENANRFFTELARRQEDTRWNM